jgi:hypothetical protein
MRALKVVALGVILGGCQGALGTSTDSVRCNPRRNETPASYARRCAPPPIFPDAASSDAGSSQNSKGSTLARRPSAPDRRASPPPLRLTASADRLRERARGAWLRDRPCEPDGQTTQQQLGRRLRYERERRAVLAAEAT